MATRNRTTLFRKHRDAIKAVKMPDSSLMGGGGGGRNGGPVIEMTSLLNSHASSSSYTPLSTEDPSTSRLLFSLLPELIILYVPFHLVSVTHLHIVQL